MLLMFGKVRTGHSHTNFYGIIEICKDYSQSFLLPNPDSRTKYMVIRHFETIYLSWHHLLYSLYTSPALNQWQRQMNDPQRLLVQKV